MAGREPELSTGLPQLDRYAKLIRDGREHVAGYTETSRGCLHMCRHCPIPPVYGGRFFVIHRETVLADLAALVDQGAAHITFGDPDFFNGPKHGMAIVRELQALDLARRAGRVLRPTFVPFTPWTTLDQIADLVDFLAREDLIGCVDPVQLSVRLLVPPGSLLLGPDTRAAFGELDSAALSYQWLHPDPRVDRLQQEIASIAADDADDAATDTTAVVFARIRELVHAASGRDAVQTLASTRPPGPRPPRLSESWFC